MSRKWSGWQRSVLAAAIFTLAACAEGSQVSTGSPGPSTGGVAGTGGTDGGAGAAAGSPGAGAAGIAGSPGPGGAAGSAGSAGNPCAGVTCNAPPASTCAGGDLVVYEAVGTCGATGTCSYSSATTPCPNGCANGACTGDPCIGVTCVTPPKNTCADATHLSIYQSTGVCDAAGKCTYDKVPAFCPFGCQNDVCLGDPCAGVSCNTPSSSYCKNADYLTVYDVPGTCNASGQCSYPSTHDVYCAFGCSGTGCTGDPCAGKTCTSPPAANCKDGNTARTYPSTGTCTGGTCSYPETLTTCPYGCVNGVCRDCQTDANCGAGKFCQGGACAPCDSSSHCGATCADCAASSKVCSGGQCVECTGTGLCSAGKYCSSNVCVACTDDAHCGASCAPCSAGTRCDGSSCVACESDSRCGAACAPCGGATPHCKAQGAASLCVACLSTSDCSSGDVCDTTTGTCRPPCPSSLTSVFRDDFATPNVSSWTTGEDVQVSTSRWRAYAVNSHGVRISGGRLAISNYAGSIHKHGQGYAYVPTSGVTSAYDNALYDATLGANSGKSVVWSFNMRRDDPESTSGGFACSSPSSQNGITVGLAYVLATDSAAGLNANAGTCSSSASGKGYAVVLGGSRKLRLVRFSGGLRNGTLTDLIASSNFSSVSNYFSVRVTYDAPTHRWQLEARSDGSSSFAEPSTGSFSYTGTATDSTYVNEALGFSGPYFQSGCTGLCSSDYTALFDNVQVGVRCAP
ncbi:MAG: hypothetical protein OZ921_15420 [Sorangiineae bacterium]|nr:hypothetical protein [Polyangiaceae bacterium]MEB2323900.1 hypothetical protein [Sorangiineae bacterium]